MDLFDLFVKIKVDDQASSAIKKTGQDVGVLSNQIKSMSAQYDNAKKKVAELTAKYSESAEKTGATSKETVDLAKQLDKAEKEANEAKGALDSYNKELTETDVNAGKAESSLSSLIGKLGKGLQTAAKIGAVAISGAAAGVAYLTKEAVASYAEYEQLIGGVETLFKDSAEKVERFADNAFKTAGLSANAYMETVTSFSASLLQSVGKNTYLAAEYADMALIDMADNANKMGTEMKSIQNAYQGFAKQNYTMLDNLKLGYGGTKEEMRRLLRDAEKLEGYAKGTFDESNFADIVTAIHVIQTELGITGTTATEAATTIKGSAATAKAAWQNLLTGMADDTQNFDKLVNNFVDSAVVLGGNLLPRVKIALNGISRLVEKMLPEIAKEIPDIISDTAPQMVKAGANVVFSLIKGVKKNGDKLAAAFFDTLDEIAELLPDKFSRPVQGAVDIAENAFLGFFRFISDHGNVAIGVIAGIGAAFLTWKAASTISSTVTAINAFVQASGKATLAQAALNAVMNANPIVLTTAAVGLLTAGLVALCIAYSRASEDTSALSDRQKELIASAREAATSYDDLKRAAAEQAAADIANIDHSEKLYNELRQIADANGKVKAGYESRARFILGELNSALGTEYSMNGNIITQYSDMVSSIGSVIEAKRAEILLQAQEETYRQAVENASAAEQARAASLIAVAGAQRDVAEAQERMNAAIAEGDNNSASYYAGVLADAQSNLQSLEAQYMSLDDTVKQYYVDIATYEEAATAAIEGNSAEAIKHLSAMSGEFQTATSVMSESAEEQKRILGEQVVETQINAQLMKEAYINGVTGVSEEMVATAEQQAATAIEEFNKVGGNIPVGISDGASEKAYLLPDEMQRQIDDAIAAANNASNGFNEVGTAISTGISNGILSKAKAVAAAAEAVVNKALEAAKKVAKIQSPSRVWRDEVGVMLARGLGLGFTEQMPKELNRMMEAVHAESFTENLMSEFNSSDRRFTRGKQNSVVIHQNIYSQAKTAADLMQEAYLKQRQAVWLGV